MNNIRVVIADDDRQITEIHQRFLEKIEGFELVGLSHDLEETEEIIGILKPDLLILDIRFPTGTGLDLLRKLRASKSQTDIILITAAKEVETLSEAIKGGIFDYILKPLVFDRLKSTLDDYRKQLNKLNNIDSISQSDVDTILARKSKNKPLENPIVRLPKGIDALTLQKIKDTFKQSDETYSAEEVGKLIGASRTTARRYLEYMVSTNDLMAEISYGTVGRPERKYSRIDIDL